MKDNAYDGIRRGKFKTPKKIKLTEELLRSHDTVVNWWCRQSGKTLTAVKIGRDIALSRPGARIIVIAPKRSNASYYIEMFSRSIDRAEQSLKTEIKLELKNGSVIEATSAASFIPTKISEEPEGSYDFVIVDEFEFMPANHFSSILGEIKKVLRPPVIRRLWRSIKQLKSKTKFLFVSSMQKGLALSEIKETLPHAVVSKLNWEATNADREKLLKIMGPEAFQIAYDSYK